MSFAPFWCCCDEECFHEFKPCPERDGCEQPIPPQIIAPPPPSPPIGPTPPPGFKPRPPGAGGGSGLWYLPCAIEPPPVAGQVYRVVNADADFCFTYLRDVDELLGPKLAGFAVIEDDCEACCATPKCFHEFIPCSIGTPSCPAPEPETQHYLSCQIDPPPILFQTYRIDDQCWIYIQDVDVPSENILNGPAELEVSCFPCCEKIVPCWKLATPCACSQDPLTDLHVRCVNVTEDIVFEFDGECYEVGPASPETMVEPANVATPSQLHDDCETCCDETFGDCDQCTPANCPDLIQTVRTPQIVYAGCGCVLNSEDRPAFNPYRCGNGANGLHVECFPPPNGECTSCSNPPIFRVGWRLVEDSCIPGSHWLIQTSIEYSEQSPDCQQSNGVAAEYTKPTSNCPAGTYSFDNATLDLQTSETECCVQIGQSVIASYGSMELMT